MMNLSSEVMECARISGSLDTPTLEATQSPKDLDIANPGIGGLDPRTQTRAGPTGLLSGVMYVYTQPPEAYIRASSATLSGL